MFTILLNTIDGIKEVDIPYKILQTVYYCYKKRNKWVARRSYISSVWATNIVGVELDNGWKCFELDRLFLSEQDAIDFCVSKNKEAMDIRKHYKLYNKGRD